MRRTLFSFLTLVFLVAVWFTSDQTQDPTASTPVGPGGQTMDPSNSLATARIEAYRPQTPASLETESHRDPALVGSTSANAASNSLTLRLAGLQPQGSLRMAIFRQSKGFPNANLAAHTMSTPVSDKTAEMTIGNLYAGTYAIALFQDLNEDGVLNKGAFGMPVEPYGFSNNVRGKFGPPSFDAASFEIAEKSAQMDITLR